jgi:phosphatidylglycerophosphate synthase
MSKLSKESIFLDFSDYGRPFGKLLALQLQHTRFTAIHVTYLFGIVGLIGVFFILNHQFISAGICLILKSIIDSADGELARLKQKPSYIGRYLDSLYDIALNFLILTAIGFVSETNFWLVLLAFFLLQLQGTLYNYYYVILRNRNVGGDSTSKIFEYKTPLALHGESQKMVHFLFTLYLLFYGTFDKIIHFLDPSAYQMKDFPRWFMTFLSLYGLGFQLLIIAVLLALGKIDWIVPTLIIHSVFLMVLIPIRRFVLPK